MASRRIASRLRSTSWSAFRRMTAEATEDPWWSERQFPTVASLHEEIEKRFRENLPPATSSLEAIYHRVDTPEDAEHAIEATRTFRRYRAYYGYFDEFRPETSAELFAAFLRCGLAVKSAKTIVQARELGVSVTNETLRDAVVGLLEDREKDGHVEEDAEDFGKALWHVYRGAVEAGALPDQTTGQLILDAMIKENKLGLALKLAAEFRMNAIDLSVNADKMMEDACNMGMTLVASEAESLLVGTQTTGNVISRCKLALLLGDSAKALGLLKQIEHDGELEQALDALKLWPSLLFTNSAVPRGLLKPSMLKGHMEALVHGGIQLDLEAAFEGIESLDTAVEPEK